jgi:gliding motility-associated-like protein
MNAGILVTPPAGFEVSTDNVNFGTTVTVGTTGTINATTVYIRLTSKTPVGNYSGNIILSSSGATDANVPVPNSVVKPAPLIIAANNVQKSFGQTLTNSFVSTGYTSTGLQNNETIGSIFITYNSGADATAKAGTYPGSVVPSAASGGSFDPKNYTITYRPGDIIVIEGAVNTPVTIPNAFTPNGDGINDVWNIKSLIDYPSCLVSIFTRYGSLIFQSRGYAKPWDGNYNGSPLPTGTYYYIINLQNGQQPLSGYVALIR